MLECVINISEGRDQLILDELRDAAGHDLLDVHSDPDHNRSVFTVVGQEAPRRLAVRAVQLLDVSVHNGVHPRLGAVDVVPFVPLKESTMTDAIEARDAFAQWASDILHIPVSYTGLNVHSRQFDEMRGTHSSLLCQMAPHPTAGAMCVGARKPLIAYNVWLAGVDVERTKRIAAAVRTEHIRTLGLQVGDFTQVSMNLIEPDIAGPFDAYRAVAAHVSIHSAELVGLLPEETLKKIPKEEWEALDLSEDRTIEWRLTHRS